MALARQGDGNLLIDFSDDIELIPRVVTTLSDMNLYSTHNIQTDFAQVEIVREVGGELQDTVRGGERFYVGAENAKTFRFDTAHFPLDRQITRGDIQNFREYGTGASPKTLASEVRRVMERIKTIHARTREAVIIDSIRGNAYAPNGTIAYDYYDEFKVSTLKKNFNLNLADPSVDPRSIIETEARAHIIDNANDGAMTYKPVVLFSRKGFEAFSRHPLVTAAYQYYKNDAGWQHGRQRLGMGVEGSVARRWETEDVIYLEDISQGANKVKDTECLVFPLGIHDHFRMYYSPRDAVFDANVAGREIFLFYKEDRFNEKAKVISETNMIMVNTRPELTCHGTVSYTAP